MNDYDKKQINKQAHIRGNIKDFSQEIDSLFYEETEKMPPKVAVYMKWKDKETGEEKSIKSTYFSSTEQFKKFLLNMAESYGYFLAKRDKLGSNWKFQVGNIVSKVKKSIKDGIEKAI